MQNDKELKYKEEIAQLKQKILILEDNFFEVLKNADMAIVETRADMRIINADGAIDLIFQEGIKYFERGENLLTVIYKSTHNTRPSIENNYLSGDEIDTIEDTVMKFVEGTLEEKIIRIVGEKESGELFLLIWKIKRKDKTFKSFFRIIPTNSIIQASHNKHLLEIGNLKKIVRDTMNMMEEGIVILNLKNEIEYMNSSAKRFFFSENTAILRNAPVEGRFFQEIFVNESSDDIKQRLDYISRVISGKRPMSYTRKKSEKEYIFKVFPQFNEKKLLGGTILIIKDDNDIFSTGGSKEEIEKLSKALKYYSNLSRKTEARLIELDNNQKWLTTQNSEFQSALRAVYTFMDNLPVPVAILSLPSRKYEYANVAFFRKFELSKETMKGKIDDEIFAREDAEVFASKNTEAIETLEVTKVSAPNYFAKQVALVNANNKPTHLLRVFL